MRLTVPAFFTAIVMALGAAAAAPPDWSRSIPADSARTDLTTLYDGLQSAHYDLFVHRTKEEYDELFAETMESISAPMSRYELFLLFQKFVAYGNVAHARIDFPSTVYESFRANGGKAFPIYLRIVDGRAFVGENYSGSNQVALGDEILSIDGKPMAHWLERTAQYISADTPYIAHSLLEFYFPMYLWVATGEREHFSIQIINRRGQKSLVRIASLNRDELMQALEEAPTTFVLDASSREARMLTNTVAYLRPGPFYNVEEPQVIWDNNAFIGFIDEAFESFLNNGAESLIIDLRDNPGGDNSFSDVMISWVADKPFRFASRFLIRSSDQAAASNQARLAANPETAKGTSALFAEAYAVTPRGKTFEFNIPLAKPREGTRFEGKVYVLVNRHSYSNAVIVAAIVQDYGWGEVAGELTADLATTYGAMEHFSLPETGLKVGFPKAYIIRPSGDERLHGVQPDIFIETPVVSGFDDEVLDRLVEIID